MYQYFMIKSICAKKKKKIHDFLHHYIKISYPECKNLISTHIYLIQSIYEQRKTYSAQNNQKLRLHKNCSLLLKPRKWTFFSDLLSLLIF